MNNVGDLPIYPQYCFGLSITVSQFCPLRSCDILRLVSNPNFAGQSVYFYSNHPVKWIRLVGVVVAVDDYGLRRVFTIDDSRGACIECHVELPPRTDLQKLDKLSKCADGKQQSAAEPKLPEPTVAKPTPKAPTYDDVDVGMVVDVKGGLREYREVLQVKIEKMVVVKSTEQEVVHWEKTSKLRNEVLDKPWHLTDEQVTACRREVEVEEAKTRRKKRRPKQEAEDIVGHRATGAAHSSRREEEHKTRDMRRARARSVSPPLRVDKPRAKVRLEATYSALGINTEK